MVNERLPILTPWSGGVSRSLRVPTLVSRAGDRASERFIEFFTAQIRNANTRSAYRIAVERFCDWANSVELGLESIRPIHIATYVELLSRSYDPPSVKQHLAALRMLFDYLVTGQVIASNPASSVRGPRYSIKKGKTPVLQSHEMRALLESIPIDRLIGLRDRALIAVMAFSFARISAVLGMEGVDCALRGRRMWLRFHEKGGKYHEVPAHHQVEEYLDAYLSAASLAGRREPLFQSIHRQGILTGRRLSRREALAMVKRRSFAAGLGPEVCNHSFRATGITNYLENGGTIEKAQAIAAHESPRTTALYDRTDEQLTLDEIERIRF